MTSAYPRSVRRKKEEEAGEIDQGKTTTNQVFEILSFNVSHNVFIPIAKLS
jgi:hypothetical protein